MTDTFCWQKVSQKPLGVQNSCITVTLLLSIVSGHSNSCTPRPPGRRWQMLWAEVSYNLRNPNCICVICVLSYLAPTCAPAEDPRSLALRTLSRLSFFKENSLFTTASVAEKLIFLSNGTVLPIISGVGFIATSK